MHDLTSHYPSPTDLPLHDDHEAIAALYRRASRWHVASLYLSVVGASALALLACVVLAAQAGHLRAWGL